MKIHLLSGFLGSGKTTAIQNACNELMKNQKKVGVITNDQGINLVDGGLFEHLKIPNRKVVNGCFCCNYNDLENSIQSLVETNRPDVIFAESVGSCTDIVATVFKPLLRFREEAHITFSTFADVRLLNILLGERPSIFDESVRYVYLKQLEEAEIVVITKIDLIDEATLREVKKLVKEKYGNKILLFHNLLNSANIRQWLDVLNKRIDTKPLALHINYDIYGEGEAKLAWLDQQLEIQSRNYNAGQATRGLIKAIARKIHFDEYPFGHLKFLLDGEEKVSVTYGRQEELVNVVTDRKANYASLLINARVQTSPEVLSDIVSEAIRGTEIKYDCRIAVESSSIFAPGYPKPTHRIID